MVLSQFCPCGCLRPASVVLSQSCLCGFSQFCLCGFVSGLPTSGWPGPASVASSSFLLRDSGVAESSVFFPPPPPPPPSPLLIHCPPFSLFGDPSPSSLLVRQCVSLFWFTELHLCKILLYWERVYMIRRVFKIMYICLRQSVVVTRLLAPRT